MIWIASRCPLLLALQLLTACSGLLGKDTRITAGERAGLVVTSESISNPTLGFSVPNPHGTFSVQPEIQRALEAKNAKRLDTMEWWLIDPNHATFTIEATRFPEMSEEVFRTYVQGYQKGAVLADTVFENTVRWTTRGDARLSMRVSGGFITLRCLSRSGADHLIVCAEISSKDSTGLAGVPASLVLKE